MNDDAKIWQDYARRVTPVGTRKTIAAAKKTGQKPARERTATIAVPVLRATLAAPLATASVLERKREKSLRDGSMIIDATLDLHGLTQDEAFDALARFMRRHCRAGHRHLLIVTGKGSQSGNRGGGVLRANLRGWLEQLPESARILALRPASARHGGGGAFYIILRKSPIPRATH
ncbi:MAG: Smr/MutS family protein [Alphaproteobacteria bacterium]|nr:Smr/MutS family protein [Alphaproteobacteria bacterium]